MYPPNSKKCPYSGYVIARNYEKTLYLIINFDGKLDPLWHPYDEVITDLNSPIIMEIEKNSISTP